MRFNLLTLLIITFCLFACDDIIEEDITREQVEIYSPANNLVSTTSTVNFLWQAVDGADEYQLEVVRGRFDSIVRFELDTFIALDRFTYNFSPGEYEWSIRALNSIGSTPYEVRQFKIDSTSDISQSTVILQFPVGGIYSEKNLTLQWGNVFSATKYIIETIDDSNGNLFQIDTTTTNSLFISDSLESKVYRWKVKAVNAQSQTLFTESKFEIDNVKPIKPVLVSPTNQFNSTANSSFSFQWQSGTASDKNWLYDSIYVYSGSTSSQPVRYKSTIEMHTDSFSTGTYLWRIKSFDIVNNKSDFSDTRTFIIQ